MISDAIGIIIADEMVMMITADVIKTKRAENLQEMEVSALECGCRNRRQSTTLTGMYIS